MTAWWVRINCWAFNALSLHLSTESGASARGRIGWTATSDAELRQSLTWWDSRSPLLLGEELTERGFRLVDGVEVALRIDEGRHRIRFDPALLGTVPQRILDSPRCVELAEAAVLATLRRQPDVGWQAPERHECPLEIGPDARIPLRLDEGRTVRHFKAAPVHHMEIPVPIVDGERPCRATGPMAEHMGGERQLSQADRFAVLEPVIHARSWILRDAAPAQELPRHVDGVGIVLSLIHISEPTRLLSISYA